MKYLLTGGGTSGHVNPAIAVAKALQQKDPQAEILFVGTKKGLESRLVPREGFNIMYIDAQGLSRSLSPRNILAVFKAVTAYRKARGIIKKFKPDVAIGTGGYVSGPVMMAAAKLKVKTAIHESNAYPGVTTRMLAKRMDVIMLGLPLARQIDNLNATIVTGNPIKSEILKYHNKDECKKKLGLDAKPLIVSVGGSRGARTLNDCALDMFELSAKERKYNHIHSCGAADYAYMCAELKKRRIPYDGRNGMIVQEYIDNMPLVYGAADLIICRAGAMTISELSAKGIPAVLVPSPNVTENHQYHNAKTLVDAHAADMAEDSQATGALLYQKADAILSDPHKAAQMGSNLKRMAMPFALDKVVNRIQNLISKP